MIVACSAWFLVDWVKKHTYSKDTYKRMNCRGEKEGADGNLVESSGECFELKSEKKELPGAGSSHECGKLL